MSLSYVPIEDSQGNGTSLVGSGPTSPRLIAKANLKKQVGKAIAHLPQETILLKDGMKTKLNLDQNSEDQEGDAKGDKQKA